MEALTKKIHHHHHHHVFVSFRGKDTRHDLMDHLFTELKRKSIVPFTDSEMMLKGESIGSELRRAIQLSLIYIVVFSKNYASSTWCLRELVDIIYFAQECGKLVLPVFYNVDPSHVRHQKGSFGEAFIKHEESFGCDSEAVLAWRDALTQVASLCGWDLRCKSLYVEIENIVDYIVHILRHQLSSLSKDLVGMKSNLWELEKDLHLDLVGCVLTVGVCGMRGIGKTTLAAVLFDKISHEFDVNCIIDDLSKIYREDGAIGVQKQIISQTLGKDYLEVCNIPYNAANLIRSRLSKFKTLIILDNVDHVEQVEKLCVNWGCLNPGSRIIIICRCEDILRECGVDVIYKVPLLNWTKSLKLLLRQKAFKRDHIMSNYDHLACEMLSYTNGLPMAIKILGSFLFGRHVTEWKSALTILKKSPNRDIMDVLRLSYDGLEEMNENFSQKKVFPAMTYSATKPAWCVGHDSTLQSLQHVFSDENAQSCSIM